MYSCTPAGFAEPIGRATANPAAKAPIAAIENFISEKSVVITKDQVFSIMVSDKQ